jgi:hypothetical protein
MAQHDICQTHISLPNPNISTDHNQRHLQTRTILIIPSNQQRHTKRPTHDSLLTIRPLTKPQRQITNGLRATLYAQRLIVMKGMVLALNTTMFDHTTGIGLQTAHRTSDMSVYLDDLLDGAGFEERGGNALFDT